jgi:predicted ATPase
MALMATWEITITCRDGSRLRFSERRDYAPHKGDILETADTGQTIKARIDAYREEKPAGIGDRDATFAAAHRTAALAQKFGLLLWRAGSLLLTGWATAVGSGVADAARLMDAEIDNATAAGPLPQYYLGLAAEVLLAAGRPADGLAHLDRAIAGIEEPGIGFYLPEIYRLRGVCLLALDRGNKDEARLALATARDIAQRQGAVIFERRAEMSLSQVTNVGMGG